MARKKSLMRTLVIGQDHHYKIKEMSLKEGKTIGRIAEKLIEVEYDKLSKRETKV